MQFLYRMEKAVMRSEEYAVIALLSSLVVLQLTQVLFRYVLRLPLPWAPELSRFVFVWMIMIGAGLASAKAAHFSVDFLVESMPRRLRRVFYVVAYAAVLLFAVVLVRWGVQFAAGAGGQLTASLRVPYTVPYSGLVVGGVLMCYHGLMAVPIQLAKLRGGENTGDRAAQERSR